MEPVARQTALLTLLALQQGKETTLELMLVSDLDSPGVGRSSLVAALTLHFAWILDGEPDPECLTRVREAQRKHSVFVPDENRRKTSPYRVEGQDMMLGLMHPKDEIQEIAMIQHYANLVVFCFDLSNPPTLDKLLDEPLHIVSTYATNVPRLLVGTKSDLSKTPIAPQKIQEVLKKLNAEVYIETSAHTNSGTSLLVDSILDVIARDISAAMRTSPKAETARVFQTGLARSGAPSSSSSSTTTPSSAAMSVSVNQPPAVAPAKLRAMEEDLEVIGEGAKMVEVLAGNLSLGENSPLHSAASKGELVRVKYLCETGEYKIDSKGMCEWTPLHLAAQNGHSQVCDFLLSKGANKDAADIAGSTPLHFAAQSNHLEVVKVLLRYGASTRLANASRLTAAQIAEKYGCMEILKLLDPSRVVPEADERLKALRLARDSLQKLMQEADSLRADGKEKLCKVKYLQFSRQTLGFLVELEKFAYKGGYLIYKLEAFLEEYQEQVIDGVIHLVPTNKADVALLYLSGPDSEEQVQNIPTEQVARCAHRTWEWVQRMCAPIK